MAKPKVLMVEDYARYVHRTRQGLGDAVELIVATTLDDGFTLFELHKNSLDLILMDACVPGDNPNTMPLVQHMRASGFTKPIIAISSDSWYRQQLIQAGASDECHKPDAAKKVLEVLRLV